MSLLDNNDDFEFEPHTLERTNTTEPLFESPEEVEEAVALQTPQRPKKKGKVVDDRKGSALSLGRRKPKDKDAATDKTPKRKRTKSISRSPPDSPKSSRAAPEPRKSSKATVPPLQPSPNVKGNRRRYSQFQGDSSSEDEGEKGTLLSNWAATEQDQKAGSAETSPRSIPTTPEPSEMSPLKRSPSPKPPLPPFPVSFPPQFSTPEKVKAGAPVALSPLQPPAFFHSPLVPRQATPSNQAPLAQPWQPETTPTANEPDWSISEELRQKCHKQFLELRPTTGLLSGEQARHFFVQSKLPNHQLSLIWRLADVDKDNALSEEEFCIAMKLVVMRRKGVEMPSTLPEALLPKQELFTDSFWPQSASATQPQALPPPSQGFKQQQHAPFFSSHSAIDLPVPSDLSMTAEAHSPLGTQASAPDILAPTTAEETRDSQRAAVNPILVEIGDTSTLDTGPLVSLEESHSEPPTGKIISLEGESEGDEDDTALVSKAATVESPTEVEQPVRDIKPARPAPPKPQVRRAKSLKAAKPPKPELPPRPHFDDQKRAVGGSSSSNSNSNKQVTSPDAEFSPSPPTLKSAEEYEAFPVITVDKASPSASARKGSRPTTLSPAAGRKKYSALASEQSTPDASPNEGGGGGGGGGGGAEEKVVGGRFGWQQLKGSREKGHARASSLDLNKVLQSSDSDDVHKDMPSAVPPKPPPKPSIVHHHDDDQGDDKSVLRTRVRSASTGSIDVTELPPEDPHILETSTNALLLVTSNKPRPHPRKAPLLPPQAKPRRPAPMMIKHRVEGESYQTISSASPPPVTQPSSTSESKATPTPAKTEESQPSSEPASLASASKEKPSPPPPTSTAAASVAATAAAATGAAAGGGGQVPRDKIDMQMSIRSLKENNAALTEINKTLEEKLFKLMEDRVMLDRELVLANQLLQHHIQQQQQQQ